MSRELSKSGRFWRGCQLGLLDFFWKRLKKDKTKSGVPLRMQRVQP